MARLFSEPRSPFTAKVTLPLFEATLARSQPLWGDSPHIRGSFCQSSDCHWGRWRSSGWWSQELLLVKQRQLQTLLPWAGQCLGYCWRTAGNAEGVHTAQESGFASPSSSSSSPLCSWGMAWGCIEPCFLLSFWANSSVLHTSLLPYLPQEEDLICWWVMRKRSLHKLLSLTINSFDSWHLEYKRSQKNIPSLLGTDEIL